MTIHISGPEFFIICVFLGLMCFGMFKWRVAVNAELKSMDNKLNSFLINDDRYTGGNSDPH